MLRYKLIDVGANNGICAYMVSQIRILLKQAYITIHKGRAIAAFHLMSLLVEMEVFAVFMN
jgi:hypothetical protein